MSNEPQQDGPVRAIALHYEEDASSAPRVVAQGVGDVAEKILAIAGEHGVPIQSNSDLVTLLSACDLGEEIPVELYSTVAELLTWLYGLNESLKS